MCTLAATWHVRSGDYAAAAQARNAFRGAITACFAADADIDGAEIIFGELVTNAVRYSGTDVTASVRCSDHRPMLEVRDRGDGFEIGALDSGKRLGHADGGRGLMIVRKLSPDVRFGRERGDFVVTADLPLECRERH